MSFVRIYVRNGKVLIPKVVQTPEGIFIDAAPVEVVRLRDVPSVKQALYTALERGNESVTGQTPEGPGSVILEAVGIKRWEAFEKSSILYSVHITDKGVTVYITGRGPDGMWVRVADTERTFCGVIATADAADYLVEDMLSRRELAEPEPSLPMLLPPPENN